MHIGSTLAKNFSISSRLSEYLVMSFPLKYLGYRSRIGPLTTNSLAATCRLTFTGIEVHLTRNTSLSTLG